MFEDDKLTYSYGKDINYVIHQINGELSIVCVWLYNNSLSVVQNVGKSRLRNEV